MDNQKNRQKDIKEKYKQTDKETNNWKTNTQQRDKQTERQIYVGDTEWQMDEDDKRKLNYIIKCKSLKYQQASERKK